VAVYLCRIAPSLKGVVVSWRYQDDRGFLGTYYRDDTHEVVPIEFVSTSAAYLMSTGKEGHWGYPDLPGAPDCGGVFGLTYKKVQRTPTPVGHVQAKLGYSTHHYSGSIIANLSAPNGPAFVDGSAWGAEAYSKMKPDNSIMSGLNAIYELKDVPGMLQQRFLKQGLSGIGDYYLALKFGWEPLLRDIRDFVLTQRKAQERLANLLRNEGRPVRRKLILKNTASDPVVSPDITGLDISPNFVTYFFDDPGHVRTSTQSTETVWGSARFRVWLPGGPRDIAWKRQMLAALYGFRPTPSVIYKAIPWSWLVDWFGNVGHVIHNMDSDIGARTAADYCYVMREIKTTGTKSATVRMYPYHNIANPQTITATSTWTTGSKARSKGDPFGWNTNQNSLNGVQLSILGALGLSRLR